MYNRLLGIAALSGFVAVVLGAFASHVIRGDISPRDFEVLQTANRYHFYHTLAILLVAILYARDESNFLRVAAYGFINGIVLFCGSLYLLSMRTYFSMDLSFLGPVTPLGGLFFILGWLLLAYYGFFLAKVQRFKKKIEKEESLFEDLNP